MLLLLWLVIDMSYYINCPNYICCIVTSMYSHVSFIKRHVIICKKGCNKKYRNMILLPQNQHNDPVYPKQTKKNKQKTNLTFKVWLNDIFVTKEKM